MNQKTFWPSVYKVNVNRYPELISQHGNANNVMKAEKKAIWDALHYDGECKLIATKQGSKCRGRLEDRHRRERTENSFTKKSAFKTCKYKANGQCVGANVKLDQSLQFLRWLLFSVDPSGFYEYVHMFPHQLTEKDYGYNIEEREQYIPEPIVQELQQVYMNAEVQELPEAIQRQIESAESPIFSRAEQKRSPVLPRGRLATRVKRASPKRSDNDRLKECVANSKRLEQKLQEHSMEARELAQTLEANRKLNRELAMIRKELASAKAERDDLDRAYKEAEKYAKDCVTARAELKDVRKQVELLAKQPTPSEADLKRAFDIMTKKMAVVMTRGAVTGSQAYVSVANNIKKDFLRVKEIMNNHELSTNERATELIRFYIELFDTETGHLGTVL